MKYKTKITRKNIEDFVEANGDRNIIHIDKDETKRFLVAIREPYEDGVVVQGAWSLAKLEYLPEIIDQNIKWIKINFQSPLIVNDEKEIQFEIEKKDQIYKVELTEDKGNMKKIIINADIGLNEIDINEKLNSLEKKVNGDPKENEIRLNGSLEINRNNFSAYLRSIGITEQDYFRKHDGISGMFASIFIPTKLIEQFNTAGSKKEPGHLIYKIQRLTFNGKNNYVPLDLFGKITIKRKGASEIYSSDLAIIKKNGEAAVYSNNLSAKLLEKSPVAT